MRCDGGGAQAVAFERLDDVLDADLWIGEREVDVETRELIDLAGSVDRRQRAHRIPVGVRRIAVDELTEQPQAGSILDRHDHNPLIQPCATTRTALLTTLLP